MKYYYSKGSLQMPGNGYKFVQGLFHGYFLILQLILYEINYRDFPHIGAFIAISLVLLNRNTYFYIQLPITNSLYFHFPLKYM